MKGRWRVIGFVGAFLVGGMAVALTQELPFSAPAQAQTPGEAGERVMVVAVEENINGEETSGEVRIRFEDPDDLPGTPADASGLLLSQKGNSLILGTGSIEVEVGIEALNDDEPVTTVSASHDGDSIEVVVNDHTRFFQDTTERPKIMPADIENGEMTLQRTVESGSLADIGQNMLVRAWGHEQNGKLVADLLVYEPIR